MVSRKGTAVRRILPVMNGTSDRSGYSDVAAIPYVSQLSGLSVDEFPRARRIDTQQAPPIPPRGFQIHARTKKLTRSPRGSSPAPARLWGDGAPANEFRAKRRLLRIPLKAWISWGVFTPFKMSGTADTPEVPSELSVLKPS